MRYLYGDSSAFPLNENFIETLAAATDCSVALLKIDEKLHKARHTTRQVTEAANKEQRDIERVAARMNAALDDDELSNATSKVVAEVQASAKAHFVRALKGIDGWRQSTIEKAHRGTGPADVMAPLDRFFVRHELPYTAWGLRWRAGESDADPVQAQVYAVMQRGLTATLAVTIPEGHRWAQPVRVSQIEKKLSIELMGKSWLGKEKMKEEALDRLYVTKITRTSERHAFELGKKPRETSAGFRFVMSEAGKKQPTVQRLDGEGQPSGDPVALSQLDALKLKKLWREIEQSVADLVFHRSRLLASTFHQQRVTELPTPIKVAMVLIQSVAPLVRDMAAHSRTPGELQLKRDLGDGRREELFIDAHEITKKYSQLTPRSRELYTCFGLEAGRGADFDLQTSYSSIPAPALGTSSFGMPSTIPPQLSPSVAPSAPPPPLPPSSERAPRSQPVPTYDVSAELLPPPPALPSEVGPASAIVPVHRPPPPRRALPLSSAPPPRDNTVSASGFSLPKPSLPARRGRSVRAVNS